MFGFFSMNFGTRRACHSASPPWRKLVRISTCLAAGAAVGAAAGAFVAAAAAVGAAAPAAGAFGASAAGFASSPPQAASTPDTPTIAIARNPRRDGARRPNSNSPLIMVLLSLSEREPASVTRNEPSMSQLTCNFSPRTSHAAPRGANIAPESFQRKHDFYGREN